MPYASFVEEGTRAHEIWPKEKRGFVGALREGQTRRSRGKKRSFLRFTIGGRIVFARMVKHPGSKSYPFMGIAFIKAERIMYREIEVSIANAARILET